MPLLPSRRWFQFRLSTWFVLVAILAGAMTMPWMVHTSVQTPWRSGGVFFNRIEKSINPGLLGPALALAAFVGWKFTWLIVDRWRTRRATH